MREFPVRPALPRVFSRMRSRMLQCAAAPLRATLRHAAPWRLSAWILACAALPGAPLRAEDVPAAPPSATLRYLQSTLHVRPEVAACVAALNGGIQANAHYDRLVQLDRYVIRARVRPGEAIFSIGKPVAIDTLVAIKGSARIRRQWTWRPVITRCGLKAGQVVATSVAPRGTPARPAAPSPAEPEARLVDGGV